MRWWRRVRGWVLVASAAVVAAVAGLLLSGWTASALAGAAVGVVTAVAQVFGARGKALLDRRFDQRALLPERVVHGRLVRVREADDPILLGVHPADDDGGRVPDHVERDVQSELDGAVRRGGFVLLRGESTAGKSRAAYEAVRRLLPDHVLFAPADGASAGKIVDVVSEQRRCVVWLDDIERFLGPDRLTASAVNRMVGSGATLVATIRLAELDRFGARRESEQDSGQRDSWRAAREVLGLATPITVSRRWSEPELARARRATDRRIQSALPMTASFGLAELLANGPELARDWDAAWEPGRHPRGAALVAAAVDCRRAGLHEPLPADLLDRLSAHYLDPAERRPEPLDDALRWATTPARGSSSLLIPVRDGYLAFDYLVDVPTGVVPYPVWTDLVDWSTPEQAMRVGLAARRFARFDAAEDALGKAAVGGVPEADIELAEQIGASGRPEVAIEMLTEALAARDQSRDRQETLRIRGALARNIGAAGEHDEATRMFADLLDEYFRVFGPDHPETLVLRSQAAIHTARAGDRVLAVELFTELIADQERITGPDDPDTFRLRHLRAIWLGRGGDPTGALGQLRELLEDRTRVQGPDHPNVLSTRFQIAVWTTNSGRHRAAVDLFEEVLPDSVRVLGESHPHTVSTRYRLGLSARDCGDLELARRQLTIVHDQWATMYGMDGHRAQRVRDRLNDLDRRADQNQLD